MRKYLNILLASLFTLTLIFTFVFLKISQENKWQKFYSQGMIFYNQEKYQDAYYNFSKIKRMSKLYELSLLKEFQCANNLQDKKTALKKIRELIKHTKDKNLRPYVLYNEAILSDELKLNSKNQLQKKFAYIQKTYPKSDFAIASGYKLAQILQKNNNVSAKEKYIEYLDYAPNGKFALNSLEEVLKFQNELNKEDWDIIANAYLQNEKYNEALKAYKNTNFSKNWSNIARCYKGTKQYDKEKQTILKGLNLKTSAVEEKEISNQIDRLIFLSKADKISTLQDLYTKYSNSYIHSTVTYDLAESLTSIRSIKLYESIIENYPTSIWASNSLWEVFWYNYKLKRYRTCEELAKTHKEIYFDSIDAPRVAYWYGRTLLNEKKNKQAKDTFYYIINNYPLSYYSFLSARQLKMSKAKKLIIKKPVTEYNINLINKQLFKDDFLLLLAENNDYNTIDDLKINDEFIQSWVAYKKENYPKSINLAKNKLLEKYQTLQNNDTQEKNQKLTFSNYELKLMYPILFEDIINENAKDFKLSPYLFLSLIREESHFDKNAKSAVGALGLSQLMQPTANFIEKTSVSKDTLLNPDENIRIGMKYYRYLIDYFNGNEYLAILAYNAGPGNIDKWLNNSLITSSEIDVFVENIPYLETKNYIKKILSSYWVYINIYSTKIKTHKKT